MLVSKHLSPGRKTKNGFGTHVCQLHFSIGDTVYKAGTTLTANINSSHSMVGELKQLDLASAHLKGKQ